MTLCGASKAVVNLATVPQPRRSVMTKLKMTLLLALFVALSSFAFAVPVTYSTNSVTVSAGLFTAKYTGVTNVTATPPVIANFGTLKITCPSPCTGSATTNFTITITQSNPGSGSGNVKATISGTFTLSHGTVSVAFGNPVFIHAGAVTTMYTPLSNGGPCTAPCTFHLQVLITQVPGTVFLPEPSAALLLGLGGFGLMGLATLSRKMISF